MPYSYEFPVLRKISLSLLVLLFSLPLHAQSVRGTNAHVDIWNSETPIVESSGEEVRGSQFYLDDWSPGTVILRDNSITEVHDINYNTYEDKIIFREGETLKAYDPTAVRGFILLDESGNKKEEFVTGITDQENNITAYNLLRVIYNGDTKLLARHETFFLRNSGRDMVSNRRYSEYKHNVTYFLTDEDGNLVKTRLRKKNILNDLGNHKKELEQFIKSSKLKLRSEEDVTALLNYYDQIN